MGAHLYSESRHSKKDDDLMVLNFVKSIFNSLFTISLLLSLFLPLFLPSNQENTDISLSTKEKNKLKSTIGIIELIATITIFLGLFALVFLKYKSYIWVFRFISIPMYLGIISSTYLSIGIIGKVVQLEKTDNLSAREYWAINSVAYTVFFLDLYKLPTKLLEVVINIESIIVSDCLYIVIYITLLFLYIFLSCALLPIPLSFLTKLMINVNNLLNNKTNIHILGDYFINHIEDNSKNQSLLLKTLEITANKHRVFRIVIWTISPLTIILNSFLVLAKMVWSFSITSIGYVFLLMRMIKRTIGKIIIWVRNLSDRRLVAISFRVSLIATLTITVITNRYTPLLRAYDSSTGVLEFLASSILIPVIIEWIGAAKINKK